MATKIINEQDYYRRVYGGWLGKYRGNTRSTGGRIQRTARFNVLSQIT